MFNFKNKIDYMVNKQYCAALVEQVCLV